ncbi:MAG: FeoB-associated Cys-rich membrane protein [Dehalococcoidia bacterium]|nr:FeoB-associated Cys-rich membrane protein [Dehalococcoidia bacterium]
MFTFLTENLGTIAVGLALLGIVTAIITKLVRDKRKCWHSGCGGGCGGCPSEASCRTKH